jgi:hypothetical protein
LAPVRVSGTRRQAPIQEPPFHKWVLPSGLDWTLFYRHADTYLVRFPGLADFELDADGNVVGCWRSPTATESTVQHLHVSQVVPLTLSRQGRLVIHASAIAIGDAAAAFAGVSGSGKSTLVAAFARAGTSALCDDGLVIEVNANDVLALPGHPSIRLRANSHAELIGMDAHNGSPVPGTSESRVLENGSIAFRGRPSALRRLYFLSPADSSGIQIEAIPPAEALIEIVKHSFLLDIEDSREVATHFQQASHLVARIGCHRIGYPRRFEALPEVRSAILEHFAA